MRAVALAPLSLLLLASAVQAKLEVQQVKAIYPMSWVERPALEFFSTADALTFRYYLAGAGHDERGMAEVDTTVRLESDATGLVLFRTMPTTTGFIGQHGGRFGSALATPLNGTVKPGEYKLVLTFKDRLTTEEASFTQTIRIKPEDLRIAEIVFARDPDYKIITAPVVTPNETLYYRYSMAGFDRGGNKPRITSTLQFFDPEGKGMLPKAVEGKMDDPKLTCNSDTVFTLNNSYAAFPRPGRYIIRIGVTDHRTGKTIQRDTPVTVVDP